VGGILNVLAGVFDVLSEALYRPTTGAEEGGEGGDQD
jgi:hypothetical protein